MKYGDWIRHEIHETSIYKVDWKFNTKNIEKKGFFSRPTLIATFDEGNRKVVEKIIKKTNKEVFRQHYPTEITLYEREADTPGWSDFVKFSTDRILCVCDEDIAFVFKTDMSLPTQDAREKKKIKIQNLNIQSEKENPTVLEAETIPKDGEKRRKIKGTIIGTLPLNKNFDTRTVYRLTAGFLEENVKLSPEGPKLSTVVGGVAKPVI